MTLPTQLDADMTIDAIMRRWPATVAVLLKHRMLCVGCPIGPFHSLEVACREHDIDQAAFAAELEAVICAMS